MNRKKQVLMLASVASMIDQFNLPNIRLMQELDYEVHVACNFDKGNTCDENRIQKLKALLGKNDVRWHQWDCPRKIRSAGDCIRAYGQLQKLIRQYRVEWIHCHSPVGGVLSRIAAHFAGIPVIYTVHGFHFYQGAPAQNWLLYYPVEKLLSYWTDVLITINQEDYRFAKMHLNARRIRRIPGVGIDIERFRDYQPQTTREAFCRRYHLPLDAKILLSVGELSSRKNHRLVLSALPDLQDHIYYIICGQGELREELIAFARETGVSERIRLAGYLEDVRELYKHADVFVFPSYQEGLPAALVEAMACGLPCLVSDIRGNRELIRQESCRFKPDDSACFCKRLQALLDDPQYAAGKAAQCQKRAVSYGRKKAERKIRTIYKSMKDDR